jgi:hypothetical protein
MALFVVIALQNSNDDVDQSVTINFTSDVYYRIESGKWVINANVTTARELSDKLGIREKAAHLVMPVKGYSGRAQPDLWEWLAAQSEKING